jgi:hypothetical protein
VNFKEEILHAVYKDSGSTNSLQHYGSSIWNRRVDWKGGKANHFGGDDEVSRKIGDVGWEGTAAAVGYRSLLKIFYLFNFLRYCLVVFSFRIVQANLYFCVTAIRLVHKLSRSPFLVTLTFPVSYFYLFQPIF